jgi:hypothetical protein
VRAIRRYIKRNWTTAKYRPISALVEKLSGGLLRVMLEHITTNWTQGVGDNRNFGKEITRSNGATLF